MLIIATHNTHKLKEISEILAPMICVGAASFETKAPPETGLTFVENALIKARFLCQHTQKSVLADDSGLVVPALNGEPGVYSARYAGPQATDEKNRHQLLRNMQDIKDRNAFFYCAMVYMRYPKDPSPLIGLGLWDGMILEEEHGKNGFGYDSLFYIESHQCTAAELPSSIKNCLSHRGQALFQLKQQMIHHGLFPLP